MLLVICKINKKYAFRLWVWWFFFYLCNMKFLTDLGKRLWRIKIWVLAAIFISILTFDSEEGFLAQYALRSDISRLEQELEENKQQFEKDSRALEELETNPHTAERIARERYLMKRENEDVYLFVEPKDSVD